jgi:hypothetical protein
MTTSRFPAVSLALLEDLEKRFPDRIPDTIASVQEIYKKQGEVTVIRLLRREYDKQTANILGS